jgi:hypothetical protein
MLFHTKLKSDNPGLIFIGTGDSMHFSAGQFAGVLFVQENATNFSVRRDSQYGEELARIAYGRQSTAQNGKCPRLVFVRVFSASAEVPDRLFSRKPSVSCVGNWSLDFGNRTVVTSVKNTILVDKEDVELCAVMKTENDVLRIDSIEAIDPLVVFALGVSSFLCRLPFNNECNDSGEFTQKSAISRIVEKTWQELIRVNTQCLWS